MSGRSVRQPLAPWLLIAPFAAIFLLFTLYPLVQSVPLSMHHAFGPQATEYVGFEKFTFALSDPRFWKALRNTVLFAAGSVFIQLPVALGLAMILNRRDLVGRGLFRLLFFSPQLVGLVFVAVLASVAFQKQKGLVNVTLAAAVEPLQGAALSPDAAADPSQAATDAGGFIPTPAEMLAIPWLEEWAMVTLVLTALWMYAGFNMIYFLAALQGVSRELEEAAMIDGAGPGRRFLNVTLPSIKPVAIFVVLLSIIGSFQLFELPYIMLPEGVGIQDSGLTLVTYLFKNGFEAGDLGYATAIGWLLALMLAGFGLVQRVVSRGEQGA